VNIWDALSLTALVLAAIPAMVFLNNLRHFRRQRPNLERRRSPMSVIIPARNESGNIRDAIDAVLQSEGVEVEVVVVDDRSEDDTAAIVAGIAATHPRVRLVTAPPLSPGWCGKQHACQVGAENARHELLVFIDADLRLSRLGLAAMADALQDSGADLLSGFPRQITGTILEHLLIPLIHFVLLGFLPIGRMRQSRHPAYAAGCGQLFLARRRAYQASGGHGSIRASLMDGITLPRSFRRAGFRADLMDATDVATSRMYHRAADVWAGLSKNAIEGLAAPARIIPMTIILFGGQVMPAFLLAFAGRLSPWALASVILALALSYLPRLIAVVRFRQSLIGALLHPFGDLLLLSIQWSALIRHLLGRPAHWRGRAYPAIVGR
jgi:glycosyltransferase involved in cell wall biosynthesis